MRRLCAHSQVLDDEYLHAEGINNVKENGLSFKRLEGIDIHSVADKVLTNMQMSLSTTFVLDGLSSQLGSQALSHHPGSVAAVLAMLMLLRFAG